ncbi:MAG: hypothetical protein K2Y18_03215 [Alphaproteobacteria bacterium]|nr:hypothetical protein [Alphaproteobacteria bacterium]
MIKKVIYLAIIGCLSSTHGTEAPPPKEQIIGTQGLGTRVQFTKEDRRIEQAKRVHEMGSRMFKTTVYSEDFDYKRSLKLVPGQPPVTEIYHQKADVTKEGVIVKNSSIDQILKMDFTTLFFWWRSCNANWKEGLSKENKEIEYLTTYNFAVSLLKNGADSPRTFFVGHWEGDGYLAPEGKDPKDKSIEGMIDWLKIRQKAVDAARRDMKGHTKSKIFHYTEVNKVRVAIDNKKRRVVNCVLPCTDVDYVSYSSWDSIKFDDPPGTITKSIADIECRIIGEKPGIPRPRVFIGEFAISAHLAGNPLQHDKRNCELLVWFLERNMPYILYWQIYNDKPRKDGSGNPEGFWLIDEDNKEWPFFKTLQALYKAQETFTDVRQGSIAWLNNYLNKNYPPSNM